MTNSEGIMDQAAIDELAQTFMRARNTGERLDALPAHLGADATSPNPAR